MGLVRERIQDFGNKRSRKIVSGKEPKYRKDGKIYLPNVKEYYKERSKYKKLSKEELLEILNER